MTCSCCQSRPQRPIGRALLVLAALTAGLGALPLGAQSTRPHSRGAIIPVDGIITDIMRDSLERRIEEARDNGNTVLIFEMDTPGGMVTSALDICRAIKSLPPEIHTVAWVHNDAYSAGAMISVACNEIWMSPASAVGDCAPIMVAPTGGTVELGETERAKAESPILQEFRDSAARNGYDSLLSRAMVTIGAEVWWLQRRDDPATRRFVSNEEKQQLIDDVDDDQREWNLVESYTIPGYEQAYPVSQPVVRDGELLTMSQYDAVAFGFAQGIATGADDLSRRLGLIATPKRLGRSGWEVFAAWLNSPMIRGLLLVLVAIGGYLEFQSPGLILPGVTALIALAIFLGAPYAAGLANIWTIVVLVIGLILLAIEAFVIPGFGVAGILGFVLVFGALIGTFVPAEPNQPLFHWPDLQGTWNGLMTGLKVFTGSLMISLVGIFLLARYLPRSRLAAGLVINNPELASVSTSESYPDIAQVGDVGLVTGALRPSGQARFDDRIVDVTCPGEYVDTGQRVQVIRREGMNIVVRPLHEEPRST